ncbi:hypothetical protein VaNZ11_007842, partial [Volvox africanus]
GGGSRHRRRQLRISAGEQLQPPHNSGLRGRGLMAAVGRRLLDVVIPRRKLRVSGTSSGRGGGFGGYAISTTNMAQFLLLDEADMAATAPPRRVGISGSVIMAGLFLHQQRILPTALRERYGSCDVRNGSSRAFTSTLAAACAPTFSRTYGSPTSNVSTAGVGGGVGTDAVFSRRSDLYNSDVESRTGDYYNTSEAAGFLNPNGVPYGFFPSPVPLRGLGEGGYPILFDTSLTSSRMQRLFTALQQGGYLDAQ